MSVETRGRQAAEGLRRASVVDVEAGLVRVRRVGRRRDVGRVVVAAVVLAAALAGVVAVRDRDGALEPARPVPVGNGEIVVADQGTPRWEEFDQATGTFLYFTAPEDDVDARPFGDYVVAGQDGEEVARVKCPFATVCGWLEAFGPGPGEVSILERGGWELRVVGYDGATREVINLHEAVSDEMPSSIAWSPDGKRLAVSTDCELGPSDCPAQVWTVNRDGSDAKLVHTEPAPVAGAVELKPLIRELTWSPDGAVLAFIVHTDNCGAASDIDVWPHLVALGVQPGSAEPGQTLHVYDDIDCHGDLLPSHYPAHYNEAWSPDGTRLAVTAAGGYKEISATDGRVLEGHTLHFDAGEDQVTGPLAWLPAP